MRQNPHVRICGGPGSATTLVYPTGTRRRGRPPRSPGLVDGARGAGAGPAVRASVGVEAHGAEGVSVRAGRIRSGSPLCGTCARPTAQPQRVFMQQCVCRESPVKGDKMP